MEKKLNFNIHRFVIKFLCFDCLHSQTSKGKYSTLGANTAHFWGKYSTLGANTAHFWGKYSTLAYSMENIAHF